MRSTYFATTPKSALADSDVRLQNCKARSLKQISAVESRISCLLHAVPPPGRSWLRHQGVTSPSGAHPRRLPEACQHSAPTCVPHFRPSPCCRCGSSSRRNMWAPPVGAENEFSEKRVPDHARSVSCCLPSLQVEHKVAGRFQRASDGLSLIVSPSRLSPCSIPPCVPAPQPRRMLHCSASAPHSRSSSSLSEVLQKQMACGSTLLRNPHIVPKDRF